MQYLYTFFEKQQYVFFTSIDLSRYSVHKSIKNNYLKNE